MFSLSVEQRVLSATEIIDIARILNPGVAKGRIASRFHQAIQSLREDSKILMVTNYSNRSMHYSLPEMPFLFWGHADNGVTIAE